MKSPAFQFYPAEFLSDENVVMMSNQEIGCYMKLMCFCWREGSIPSDITRIAKLCGEDSLTMAQLWLAISPCFTTAINDASRLVHPRLEKERNKQQEHKKERSESGAKGAEARWNKGLKVDSSAIAKPIAEPIANDSSSSSTSTSTSVSIVITPKRKTKTRLPEILEPTQEHQDFAGLNNLSLSAEMVKFRLHHEEKLTMSGNWNSSFSKWLHNAVEYRAKNAPRQTFDDKKQDDADRVLGRGKYARQEVLNG